MAGRGKALGSGVAKKATSRSSKAGLQFPVGRIARFLKRCWNWLGMQQGTTRRLE
ncbi:hypothetical protein OIU77_021936 [Salix suchowensis]|uniref:Histone H2A n=1 Tax=Salix suchowensis TaxID=1278906 RepID=A0ABQ9CBG1_9ROSI|nr:hypothetical protein OIU77_021936 [Salix suchowensis]